MELLATFGVAAKELFTYNRDMYQFDLNQRLDRELLRLEMQIQRFDLFREDIRDLVDLTVSKMEMYQVVGSLIFEGIVVYFTEGRIRTAAPPFILALYWLSASTTTVYILLAVWLSMHASISSHSFGVRLLTRFVRLPIPGARQMQALNARLTDFERQGLKEMMRVPFVQTAQQWQTRREDRPAGSLASEGDDKYRPSVGQLIHQDLLGQGEKAYGDDDRLLNQAAVHLPGKHVQLFRRLQAKWQCFDAYARVSMSFGVIGMINTVSYYCICLVDIEYHSPVLTFALIIALQCLSIALGWLDIAGIQPFAVAALGFLGALPSLLACYAICTTPRTGPLGSGPIDLNATYKYSFVPFFIITIWLEGLLYLAWPSRDLVMLPKLFRTVLFLDVFAVAHDAVKDLQGPKQVKRQQPRTSIAEVTAADESVFLAEAAIRRWEAIPGNEGESCQADLKRLRRMVTIWRKALNGEAARNAQLSGDTSDIEMLQPDTRPWAELSEEEKLHDPFASHLLGPFVQPGKEQYFYDLEQRQFVLTPTGEQRVLTLEGAAEMVREAERQVRSVLSGVRAEDAAGTDQESDTGSSSSGQGGRAKSSRPSKYRTDPVYRAHRLPWQILQGLTRVIQICSLGLGVVMLCEDFKLVDNWDILAYAPPEQSGEHYSEGGEATSEGEAASSEAEGHGEVAGGSSASSESSGALPAHSSEPSAESSSSSSESKGGRRLRDTQFYRIEVDAWPKKPFSRAVALSFPAVGQWPMNTSEGIISISDVAHSGSHWAASFHPSAIRLQVIARIPPSSEPLETLASTTICPPRSVHSPCFLARADSSGLQLQSLESNETSFFRSDGNLAPWRRFAAASLRCDDIVELLGGPKVAADVLAFDARRLSSQQREWCLLLVGWNGQQLPVAVLPLNNGLGQLPSSGAITPLFDVPAPQEEVCASDAICDMASAPRVEVQSLSLDATSGRLWVLASTGFLEAWDLLHVRRFGSWKPSWPVSPLSLCELPPTGRAWLGKGSHSTKRTEVELLYLGRSGLAAPQLFRISLPSR